MKRWLYAVLTIGLYISLSALTWATNTPQCINSMIVDKLDVISKNKVNSVFSCEQRHRVNYNEDVDRYIQSLEIRLNQLMLVLNDIKPMAQPISVTVDEDNALKYVIKNDNISIGQSLFFSKGHLERALIGLWLQSELQDRRFTVFSQSTIDLIYYATFGRLDVQDPVTGLSPILGQARWPQVLKNLDIYCESPWRAAIDFEHCESLDRANRKRHDLLTMSLRPLLTSGLIEAYNSLNFSERNIFLKQLPVLIAKSSLESETAIQAMLNHDNSLQEGLSLLKVFTEQFSLKNESTTLQRRFIAYLNQYLRARGVSDSFAQAYFDVLVEFPDELSTSSVLFKSLVEASKQNINLQIAVKDQNQIWILPSRSSLSLKIFDQIKIRQHVFFACPILKDVDVTQFAKTSEKLLMIKGCDSEKTYSFETLFKFGVQEFTKQESNISFIQFHMPSLEQQLDKLKHIKNFFDLVKNRDITKAEFQLLGWQDLQWNSQYHFYKPKAVIDAIEYFRDDTITESSTL